MFKRMRKRVSRTGAQLDSARCVRACGRAGGRAGGRACVHSAQPACPPPCAHVPAALSKRGEREVLYTPLAEDCVSLAEVQKVGGTSGAPRVVGTARGPPGGGMGERPWSQSRTLQLRPSPALYYGEKLTPLFDLVVPTAPPTTGCQRGRPALGAQSAGAARSRACAALQWQVCCGPRRPDGPVLA